MFHKGGKFILICQGHEHVDNRGFVMVIGEPSFSSLFYKKNTLNPSACGHLNPSSYCDVGRLFLRGI